jgi:uncharacterized protein (TIGR03067 family)
MTFCVLVISLLQPPQPDPNVALELGKLKGNWRVVGISENGQPGKPPEVRFRFNDNVLSLTNQAGTPIKRQDGKPEERSFVLDLSATPRVIDFMISEKFKSLGIYELRGDDLKLCTAEPGSPRPSDFQPRPGVVLVALKREVK